AESATSMGLEYCPRAVGATDKYSRQRHGVRIVSGWRASRPQTEGAMCVAPPQYCFGLLRGQLLGLTLVTHELERALSLFVRRRDFFLYLGRRLFHFRREANVAIVLHARAGRN